MPTYEYACQDPACKGIIEVEHRMSEEPKLLCAKCGTLLRRIIAGPPAVHFKGSCWAKDGYS